MPFTELNTVLKEVARFVNISIPLTMYCASMNEQILPRAKTYRFQVINEDIGHDSEETTAHLPRLA